MAPSFIVPNDDHYCLKALCRSTHYILKSFPVHKLDPPTARLCYASLSNFDAAISAWQLLEDVERETPIYRKFLKVFCTDCSNIVSDIGQYQRMFQSRYSRNQWSDSSARSHQHVLDWKMCFGADQLDCATLTVDILVQLKNYIKLNFYHGSLEGEKLIAAQSQRTSFEQLHSKAQQLRLHAHRTGLEDWMCHTETWLQHIQADYTYGFIFHELATSWFLTVEEHGPQSSEIGTQQVALDEKDTLSCRAPTPNIVEADQTCQGTETTLLNAKDDSMDVPEMSIGMANMTSSSVLQMWQQLSRRLEQFEVVATDICCLRQELNDAMQTYSQNGFPKQETMISTPSLANEQSTDDFTQAIQHAEAARANPAEALVGVCKPTLAELIVRGDTDTGFDPAINAELRFVALMNSSHPSINLAMEQRDLLQGYESSVMSCMSPGPY